MRLFMLVTDRKQCARPLPEVVAEAIEGGVNMVQLREKDLPAGELLTLAQQLREVTLGRAYFFVNDRADVALACQAEGVHLPESGMPIQEVRRIVGDEMLIGRSVHSLEAARQAKTEGANYIVLGTIFETTSKPGVTPVGLELLRKVCRAVRIPVIAIGGINAGNARQVIRAGAAGVAVVSAILGAANPRTAAKELWAAISDQVSKT